MTRRVLLTAAAIMAVLFASHAALLNLPFHWDELGYFVPAALDLFRHGAWVPIHTLANIHPPGLSFYLTAVWAITGYSILATRAAMLVLATATAVAAMLLAFELTGKWPVAFGATVLLIASPLFFMQAMMTQLDLPAALFSTLALWCFLRGRYVWSALACTAAALMKETSLVSALVFAAWLSKERRWKQAALFGLPVAALAAWVIVLRTATGNAAGNPEFGWYNLVYPLHPVRLAGALLRRISYLFIEEFRWIGTAAMVLAWRQGMLRSRAWRIAASYALAQALFVTVLGGAVLERYLLPVLPVLYAAFATSFRKPWMLPAVTAGLVASLFWNPPFWPFPPENNLAMVDFVRIQQTAAAWLEDNHVEWPVATAWPFTDALRYPDFGYVHHEVAVEPLEDFSVGALERKSIRTLALYSRDWDPPANLLRTPWIEPLYRQYFRYNPPVTRDELITIYSLHRVVRWSHHAQWVEIWTR
jgi:4-amino-4-deoxy-L-arabinose transferase-like glycosyltransferase